MLLRFVVEWCEDHRCEINMDTVIMALTESLMMSRLTMVQLT